MLLDLSFITYVLGSFQVLLGSRPSLIMEVLPSTGSCLQAWTPRCLEESSKSTGYAGSFDLRVISFAEKCGSRFLLDHGSLMLLSMHFSGGSYLLQSQHTLPTPGTNTSLWKSDVMDRLVLPLAVSPWSINGSFKINVLPFYMWLIYIIFLPFYEEMKQNLSSVDHSAKRSN